MKGDILVVCSKKLNVEQVLAKNRISVFFSYVVKYHILYIALEWKRKIQKEYFAQI